MINVLKFDFSVMGHHVSSSPLTKVFITPPSMFYSNKFSPPPLHFKSPPPHFFRPISFSFTSISLGSSHLRKMIDNLDEGCVSSISGGAIGHAKSLISNKKKEGLLNTIDVMIILIGGNDFSQRHRGGSTSSAMTYREFRNLMQVSAMVRQTRSVARIRSEVKRSSRSHLLATFRFFLLKVIE
jgi:hypothetical protein